MGTHPIFESDFDCLTDMLNGAPVTRNLLIGLGVSTLVAIQFKNGSFLRKILGNFTFSSGNHLFEGAIGLYQMSQVERIIGSSILFTRLFSTTFLLLISNMIFSSFNVPQVLVFSLFPAFLQLVVPTRKLKLGWKFSVSEKMITYAVMGITFNFNQDSAVAGIIIGVLMMQWNEEIIPIGIEESEVKDPIGATIEIQRKMRMDEAEERFTRQQMEQIRIREQHIQRQIRRQQPPRQATPTPPYVPSESEIQALVSMGFNADRVRQALIHHRGNVTAACEQLISGN